VGRFHRRGTIFDRNGVALAVSNWSQLEEHRAFGGVVPEIAARAHIEALDTIVADALAQAHCTLDDLDAVALLDHFERVVDERERGESEEIHLEKLELVKTVHVVLGNDFLFIGSRERDQGFERFRRNHYAGRMHRRIAG